MIKFTERTNVEQALIRRAYQYEIEAIERVDARPNPHYESIISLREGRELWEAINEAVWLAYN